METDPAATLESLTVEYRHRVPAPAGLEVIVPAWWVQKWGHEAISAAAKRLNCKIMAVGSWEEAQSDQLQALVYEAGTWHKEPGPAIDLSGGQHGR